MEIEQTIELGAAALDKEWARHKQGLLRLSLAGFFLLVSLISWNSASAGTYNVGAYGGCGYGTDCATSSPSTETENSVLGAAPSAAPASPAAAAPPTESITSISAPAKTTLSPPAKNSPALTHGRSFVGTILSLASAALAVALSLFEFIVLRRH